MKKNILPFLFFLSLQILAQPCKEIVGYYPNWQWYDRSKLVSPASIAYSKYTIINYSFMNPQANGQIALTDPYADEILLKGQINWSTTPPSYYPNTSLIDLAHNANTKVMISIGGWTMSGNFPIIAADATKRAAFASNCNKLIRDYNFDGIDIDWEYPCDTDPSRNLFGSAADKQNFTFLMQQIKDSLVVLGNQNNKTYLLSSCFSADPQKFANIEWNNIVTIVDMINLMSYDYFGAWDCSANHNSPLFAPAVGDPTFNLNYAFTTLTTNYNVPASKVNLGLAFYGRSQKGATILHQPTNCQRDNSYFYDDDGMPTYYNIIKGFNDFNYNWDNIAKCPWLIGKTNLQTDGTFVSYDDKHSIAEKGQFVKANNARGTIIWEITGDYLETFLGSGVISTPLLDTLNSVFCNTTTSLKESNNLDIVIFPNPVTDYSTVLNFTGEAILTIFNTSGMKIMEQKISGGEKKIDMDALTPGIYLLQIKSSTSLITTRIIKQ